MTNQELQDIIEIDDICELHNHPGNFRFLGYGHCKWQTSYISGNEFICSTCKGNMTFEASDGKLLTSCHSFTNKDGNNSDVEIIHKYRMLPEELFEL